jgi:hypothetical protein
MITRFLRRLRPRLTYANIISTIALCIAAGTGTAYAAATIGSSNIIDGSIQSRDIHDGAVQTRDLGTSSVTNAKLGPSAVGSGKIADGTIGTVDLSSDVADAIDAPGRARAWARVRFTYDADADLYSPALDETIVSNISAVRRSGFTPGYYCLTPTEGVSLTGRPAVATPDWNASPTEQLRVYIDSSNNECNATEIAVVTNTENGAGRSIVPFYIVIF